MSIAQYETAPSGRIAPDSSRQIEPDGALAGRLRPYFGVAAVLALVSLAALAVGEPRGQAEAVGSLSAPDGPPAQFDGRGKWSGYAR